MRRSRKIKPTLPLSTVFFIMLLTGCSGSRPKGLGVTDGKFPPCPDKPNCVVSYEYDQEHFIDPISYTHNYSEAYPELIKSIEQMPGSKIIIKDKRYIRAEFTSRLMRYIDDVEFYFSPDEKTVQVRSASRLGHSDMGVNRERIETLRSIFGQINP